LVGRAGRQGVPGESQFLISMEDEIMQLFGSEEIIDVMEEYDIPEDEYISGRSLDEAFKRAQDFIESKNYDGRIYLYKYDRVTNFQRAEIYALRDSVLENEPRFKDYLYASIAETVRRIFLLKNAEFVSKRLRDVFNIQISPAELAQAGVGLNDSSRQVMEGKFIAYLTNCALQIGQEPEVYEASQKLLLNIIDNNWSGHLELMDVLKEEANLFSYSSPDPLIDFIKESGGLYREMNSSIQEQFLKALFLHLGQQGRLK